MNLTSLVSMQAAETFSRSLKLASSEIVIKYLSVAHLRSDERHYFLPMFHRYDFIISFILIFL